MSLTDDDQERLTLLVWAYGTDRDKATYSDMMKANSIADTLCLQGVKAVELLERSARALSGAPSPETERLAIVTEITAFLGD